MTRFRQNRQSKLATLSVHHPPALLAQLTTSLLLLLFATKERFGRGRLLQAALTRLQQRETLVVGAQHPAATRFKQLLLLAKDYAIRFTGYGLRATGYELRATS